jgi:CheY-like chemotaxis protein
MDQARENLRQAKRPPSHTTAAKPSTKARASFSEVRVPYASFILDLAKPGTGAISSKTTKTLQAMHRLLPHLVRGTDEGQVLSELCQQMGIVHSETARTGILPLHQVATALWMMFEDYRKTPSLMIPSSLRTVGQAMDLILLLTQKESTGRFPILCSTDVLAIDDDGDVLDILESQLGSLGMKTYSSRDPNLALPALQRQRFDLVLLDIGMAEQNGLELCAGIRKLEGYRRTPVVFLTGMTTGELREQATLVGGNDFVSKPFHATELGLKALFWAFKSRL